LFHLFNHAFFKALLFLAAGSIIHALKDEQDIRKMGGLFYFLPLTFTFFLIASLSLMGFPFLSGFYSKELIIEYTWISSLTGHSFATVLLIAAALFTAAYSARLFYYVFLTRPNFFLNLQMTLHEPSAITQLPLVFLALCSIFSGYYYSDLLIGFGTTFFNHSLPVASLINIDFLPVWQKQLPFAGTIISFCFTLIVLQKVSNLAYLQQQFFYYCFCFLNQKWFFDKFYNYLIITFLKQLYFSVFAYLDKGIIEYFGPYGLNRLIQDVSFNLRLAQSGLISTYVFVVLSGLFFCICLLQFCL
jgi:NADH-ubiquinone oxidoreductase chain 5